MTSVSHVSTNRERTRCHSGRGFAPVSFHVPALSLLFRVHYGGLHILVMATVLHTLCVPQGRCSSFGVWRVEVEEVEEEDHDDDEEVGGRLTTRTDGRTGRVESGEW